MTDTTDLSTSALRVQRMPRWFTGRSELIVAGGVLALAAVLAYGTITMAVPEGTAAPGPQFFPAIVTGFLALVGVALVIEVLRSTRRAHVADDPTEISHELLEDLGSLDATGELRVVAPEASIAAAAQRENDGIDWRTLAVLVAGLSGFILLLPFLGWLISSTALFWIVARAFGSRRPLFDIAVSALFAGLTQLAFSAGLGLTLPSGILEGAFPWIS